MKLRDVVEEARKIIEVDVLDEMVVYCKILFTTSVFNNNTYRVISLLGMLLILLGLLHG